MQPWKTLSRRTLLDRSPFLKVEEHSIELPGGRLIDDWTWVITPDYVNVAAFTPGGHLICFRQTKYAVQGTSLGAVGGYVEPDETPEAAARRELLEEAGYEAGEWEHLGSFAVDANRGAGTGHFFLARNACPVAEPAGDDLEEQTLLLLSRAEVEQALKAGRFKVMAWAMVLEMALRRTA